MTTSTAASTLGPRPLGIATGLLGERTFTARRTLVLALAVKGYGLLILYALFVQTDLRNGDKGFFFRPNGQAMDVRTSTVSDRFSERLAPYDGQWYLDIALNGYRVFPDVESRRGTHPPGNYAFFPLLPAFLWANEKLAGDWHLESAILILVLISALGVALASELARALRIDPFLTAALLLAFPTAAFQYVIYSEGLFLLVSAAALSLMMTRHLKLATAFAALAGLARPQGFLLVLPLALAIVKEIRTAERISGKSIVGAVLALVAPFGGLIVLAIVSASVANSADEFISIQSRWGRSVGLSSIASALSEAWGYQGPKADLLGLVFGVGLLPLLWTRLPRGLALYGTAMVLLPLSTGSLLSMGRFMSVSIPHFLVLAQILEKRHAAVRVGALTALVLGQVVLARGLIAWHLVG